MRFLRAKLSNMVYKTTVNEEATFKTLDLLPYREKTKNVNNIELPSLYKKKKINTRRDQSHCSNITDLWIYYIMSHLYTILNTLNPFPICKLKKKQ